MKKSFALLSALMMTVSLNASAAGVPRKARTEGKARVDRHETTPGRVDVDARRVRELHKKNAADLGKSGRTEATDLAASDTLKSRVNKETYETILGESGLKLTKDRVDKLVDLSSRLNPKEKGISPQESKFREDVIQTTGELMARTGQSINIKNLEAVVKDLVGDPEAQENFINTRKTMAKLLKDERANSLDKAYEGSLKVLYGQQALNEILASKKGSAKIDGRNLDREISDLDLAKIEAKRRMEKEENKREQENCKGF